MNDSTTQPVDDAPPIKSLFVNTEGDVLKFGVPITPIRDVEGVAGIKASPATSGAEETDRPRATDAHNGRIQADIAPAAEPWAVRWTYKPRIVTSPSAVHVAGDRAVLNDGEAWELLDFTPQHLADGRVGAPPIILDRASQSFIMMSPTGTLESWALQDGKVRFRTTCMSHQGCLPALIARRNELLTLITYEAFQQPHSEVPLDSVFIEIFTVDKPPKVDSYGFLEASQPIAQWVRRDEDRRVVAARTANTIVLGFAEQILIADANMKVRRILSTDRVPVALSLADDEHMALLVADEDSGALRAWAMNSDGERSFSVPWPKELGKPLGPPLIGFDGRAYLVGESGVVALAADGQPRWKRTLTMCGALVTPSGRLLATTSRELLVLNEDGKPQTLHSFEKSVVKAPPAVTRHGHVVVATDRGVHLLAPPDAK